MTEDQQYRERIMQDPKVMVGKPVVKGTRIPVELVLGQLAINPDLDELLTAYPHLTVEDVKACLAYTQAVVEENRKLTNKGQTAPASG